MTNLNLIRGVQLVAGSTLLMFATLSHAQYSWIDAKGTKQFSDRPPPTSVPQKNILKSRGATPAADDAAVPAPAGASVPAKAAPASLADREADYRKRQGEKAEADKKAGAAAEQAKASLAACAAARQAKNQIDSGVPLRDTNEERSWLSDKQRDEQKAAANKAIGSHCG